jgi:hypothetical protein
LILCNVLTKIASILRVLTQSDRDNVIIIRRYLGMCTLAEHPIETDSRYCIMKSKQLCVKSMSLTLHRWTCSAKRRDSKAFLDSFGFSIL